MVVNEIKRTSSRRCFFGENIGCFMVSIYITAIGFHEIGSLSIVVYFRFLFHAGFIDRPTTRTCVRFLGAPAVKHCYNLMYHSQCSRGIRRPSSPRTSSPSSSKPNLSPRQYGDPSGGLEFDIHITAWVS
jgi:hypothetical protein